MNRFTRHPGFVLPLTLLAWIFAPALTLFTLRRWAFLLAAVKRDRPLPGRDQRPEPDVLLLVPFRDEAANLPGLLSALERLDYPAHALTVVLVDDGSGDGGSAQAAAWAGAGANRHLLPLPISIGKAAALNAALAAFPAGELVAVYDADERPRPDALRVLCRAVQDPDVGAVSGRRVVSNPLAGPVAGHVALENLVHQLITMRAKERLNLAPALLGSNCVYRRRALEAIGGFQPGAILEDSDITVRLALAGRRTRFVPEAVSTYAAPETLAGYWRQHLRWERGFRAVASRQIGSILRAPHLRPAMRLELVLFSLGYLDRVALLLTGACAAVITAGSRRPPRLLLSLLVLAALTPLLQVMAALRHARAPAALRRSVLRLPIFYLLEVALAVAGMLRR